jgi:hypothetical protein
MTRQANASRDALDAFMSESALKPPCPLLPSGALGGLSGEMLYKAF